MADRPNVVLFDVLETLINLDPLAARLEEVGQPATVLQPWFLRFQRDAMALTLAGDPAPFEPLARESLRTETKYKLSERDIEYVVEGFSTLPTFDDAAPALKKISEAGVWKPHPDIYRYAAKRLNTPIDRLALVAVHAWDCHGAKKAGALAGWCARLEYQPGDVFLPADVTGSTLVEVADKLMVALKAGDSLPLKTGDYPVSRSCSSARLLSLAVNPQPTAASRINPVMMGDTSPRVTTAPISDATDAIADSFQE
ncbi:MAG: hypothetical protein R6W86_14285 [Marinobacter sp.]|uniref:hypothetical protein n=1 Tax=Marinobacter sp. TaxID=50741 RepID=UPI00396E86FA